MGKINDQIIESCIAFCEGKKGNTINNIKNETFPENLLKETEEERLIKDLKRQGYSSRQIATELGCNTANSPPAPLISEEEGDIL